MIAINKYDGEYERVCKQLKVATSRLLNIGGPVPRHSLPAAQVRQLDSPSGAMLSPE